MNMRFLLRSGLWSAVFASLVSLKGAALAATLSVCPSGCEFTRIQAAVDTAVSGDVITVGAGRYVENVTIDGKSLSVVGKGNEVTTVDGNGSGSVFALQGGSAGPVTAISIANLAVTRGLAAQGGGISVLGAVQVKLSGLLVAGNQALNSGGGIYIKTLNNTPSAPVQTITGCKIDSNQVVATSEAAFPAGGGVAAWGSPVSINFSAISNNSTPGLGGGVALIEPPLLTVSTIISSTITGNAVTKPASQNLTAGGGIYLEEPIGLSVLKILQSDISRNSSTGPGGGVYGGGRMSITSTVLSLNTANDGAGIVTGSHSTPLTLDDDYIVLNTAKAGAGGLEIENSPLTFIDTTLKDNLPTNCAGTGCPP